MPNQIGSRPRPIAAGSSTGTMIRTMESASKTSPMISSTMLTTRMNMIGVSMFWVMTKEISCGMRYSVIALPKTFAPATISRIATVVAMESRTASLNRSQVSVRRITPVISRAAAQPTAAASVGVAAPV